MTPNQSRIARARLRWRIADLAREAGVEEATVVCFENGEAIDEVSLQKMRVAFAKRRVRFVEEGQLSGAVYMGLRAA